MYILIIFLPLFAFLIAITCAYLISRNTVVFVILSSIFACFLFSIIAFVNYLITFDVVLIEFDVVWINLGHLYVKWSFLFDSITLIMLIVVSLVSFLVCLYSVEYMKDDVSFVRFMAFLSLFVFFMLFLVTSNNLLQMFIGWEGVGLCSYLLINFWFTRVQANKAALKAMIVNRIGDVFFLMGLCCIYYVFRTFDYGVLFSLVPLYIDYKLSIFGSVWNINDFVSFCFFIAACGKSAQLGLHVWLPDAMEGPTPVSALIHAATMVTAGVYLIVRMSIFFEFSFILLNAIIIVGSLTALFGSVVALFQNDLKKIIAYSTCSQLGYMFVSLGCSRYDLAMFHLFNHAFFKALLFLCAGVIIHNMNDEQDIRKMGGLFNFLPFTYLMMLIASLSLIGFPFFSGFYSKEFILNVVFVKYNYIGFFCYVNCLIAAFFTAFYSFRMLMLVFFSVPSGYRQNYYNIYEVNVYMGIPFFVLGFLSLFSGFFFRDMLIGFGSTFWLGSILVLPSHSLLVEAEFLFFFVKLMPLLVSFVGILLGISFSISESYNLFGYGIHNFFFKRDFFYNFIFLNLDKFNYVYKFFNQKCYFDVLYNKFFVINILKFGYYVTYKEIDKKLLEILGPFGFDYFLCRVSNFFNKIQNGYVYDYVFFILFGFCFIIFFCVFELNFFIFVVFVIYLVVLLFID